MKKRIVIKKKKSVYSKLRYLLAKDKDITITYVNDDNSKITKTLSNSFIRRKGKVRKVDDIVNDIYAINHDRGSKYFYI